MKYLFNKFIILSLIVVNCSCNDIIETSPESMITVGSFWQTEEDALGGLYGMYGQFRNFSQFDLVLLGDARSELMGHGAVNADFRIKYFENFLDETNADLDWQEIYLVITHANLVIKYVPGISFSNDENKNAIIAQGHAMRAYMYFILAKTWGDVPLITEPTEGFDAEEIFKERRPTDEVFDLIKADIDQANSLFTNNNYNLRRSIWSKPALNMLKAEVYLWTGKVMGGGQQDISTALDALNEAENSDLALQQDFSSVFSYDNKGNREIILAVNFTNLEANDNYFSHMYGNYPANVDNRTVEVVGTPGGNNWWAPSELVRNQFKEEDQRKSASFFEIYTQEGGVSSYFTTVVLKGKGFIDGGVRRFLDDIVIYRYADLLLMKAEAKNALGQDPSEEINSVRRRAYGDDFPAFEFTNGSPIENDEAILQERLFEFAFEGKRWWDLVRFDKAFEKVPSLQGREGQRHLLLWPVTLETISLNSNITQTTGY